MFYSISKPFCSSSLQTALIALRALRRNKMRSSLTALGIIIGVASVVAMVAVGNGAQARIDQPSFRPRPEPAHHLRRQPPLRRRELRPGQRQHHHARRRRRHRAAKCRMSSPISPEVSTTAQAIANGRNWSTTIAGESPDYLKIRDWKLASGSMFTDREVRSAAKVAVIGSKTAQ